MSNNNLQKELAYFKENQALLVKKYQDRFIVIKDQEVKGDYSSEIEAYTEAQKTFELGTFIIQQCLSGTESYTQTFHSRAVFS